MGKPQKFNLTMSDGSIVTNLEELESQKNIEDIILLYKNGTLLRWCKVNGFLETYDELIKTDKNKWSEVLKILQLEVSSDDINKYIKKEYLLNSLSTLAEELVSSSNNLKNSLYRDVENIKTEIVSNTLSDIYFCKELYFRRCKQLMSECTNKYIDNLNIIIDLNKFKKIDNYYPNFILKNQNKKMEKEAIINSFFWHILGSGIITKYELGKAKKEMSIWINRVISLDEKDKQKKYTTVFDTMFSKIEVGTIKERDSNALKSILDKLDNKKELTDLLKDGMKKYFEIQLYECEISQLTNYIDIYTNYICYLLEEIKGLDTEVIQVLLNMKENGYELNGINQQLNIKKEKCKDFYIKTDELKRMLKYPS